MLKLSSSGPRYLAFFEKIGLQSNKALPAAQWFDTIHKKNLAILKKTST
jgi:hypothetical protein